MGLIKAALGAAGGVLAAKIAFSDNNILLGAIVSGIIATLTIVGKALGKNIAIEKSKEIIFFVGKISAALHPKANRKGTKRKTR